MILKKYYKRKMIDFILEMASRKNIKVDLHFRRDDIRHFKVAARNGALDNGPHRKAVLDLS